MALTTRAQQIIDQSDGQSLPDPYWELLHQYRAELINQAFALLGDMEDAEDVVQETFCEALRHQEKLAHVRSLSAWLGTINRANAKNRLRDRARSNRRQQSSPKKSATTGGFTALEVRDLIAKAIEELPEKPRRVIELRFWNDLNGEAIAQRLDMPAGTVRWLLCDAYARLYQRLGHLMDVDKTSPDDSPKDSG